MPRRQTRKCTGLLLLAAVTITLLLVCVRQRPHAPAVAEQDTASTTRAAAPLPPELKRYYAGVDARTPARLRLTLHETINDHRFYPYTSDDTDTWDILEQADEDPAQPAFIIDLYRNAQYPKAGRGNDDYDREHVWPKSYGFSDYHVGNYPYTDAHHLFLADDNYNSSRGNKPFDMCPNGEPRPVVVADSSSYGLANYTERRAASGCWQVWAGRRGDVARALFYMDVRYEGGVHGETGDAEPDLVLTDDRQKLRSSRENEAVGYMGMLSVLLQWHEQDPVSDQERRRNDVIFTFQRNRNPFIDHPGWVACVYRGKCD